MTPTTKRANDRPTDPPGSAQPVTHSFSRAGVIINPETGLSTDYLNHFSEAIMLLEMLAAIPESMDDFLAWRPRSYAEHFTASNFKNREAAVAAYHAADPAARQALDAIADTMNTMLVATRVVLETGKTASSSDMLAQSALAWLKPMVTRAAYVINGVDIPKANKSEANAAQAEVDALMQR